MRDWLIRLRKAKQLTQQQVASRCFIERSYYSQIERGKRNPSTVVARNIADALEFNPLKFYKSDFNITNIDIGYKDNVLIYDIDSYFAEYDIGQIIYLYNNDYLYYKNILSYLIAGLRKKKHCFIIDNVIDRYSLSCKLDTIFTKEEILSYLHYISTNVNNHMSINDSIIYILNELQVNLNDAETIYVWLHCDLNKTAVEKIFENNLYSKALYVQAYNSSCVSASDYIKMMKKFSLLMTDVEIANSPFYCADKSTQLTPSLFLQEEF